MSCALSAASRKHHLLKHAHHRAPHAPLSSPTFPGAQNSQVDEEEDPVAALDLPSPHTVHSLSASVSVRLWPRYVPAGQLAHGVDAAVTGSAASYLVPARHTLHRAKPLASAYERVAHGLHVTLEGVSWCVPKGQSLHCERPEASPKVPSGQAAHCEEEIRPVESRAREFLFCCIARGGVGWGRGGGGGGGKREGSEWRTR